MYCSLNVYNLFQTFFFNSEKLFFWQKPNDDVFELTDVPVVRHRDKIFVSQLN